MIYDCIVVGLGIHGSSIAAHLSEKRKKILGLEKYQSGGHENGSSHGKSRIIRTAYYEDPRCKLMINR
jgi:sarcosine oxidase